MKNDLSNIRRGGVDSEPPSLELLENPLDFIKEDHMHMRAVCEMIDRLAKDPAPDPVKVTKVLTFLDHEIDLLIHDEDDDLRELLLSRCTPEDDIAETLDRMRTEHVILAGMMPKLRQNLAAMHDGPCAAKKDVATALHDFADRLRRHLLVENAIVLPFARARLTTDDVALLRASMIRRRIQRMES
ncbi:hemerythrin domain-containing protein [Antarctobacter sp.]|uniref:hemerythrin domain-containing protein n=1 Tax=Antarctobacter sp. TaxID=1872577 RepID=UPI003A90CC91